MTSVASFDRAACRKLLGRRFSTMSPATPLGGFFETLYQSGVYWRFLGLAQVAAAGLVLVLVPATATLEAVAYFAIVLNVFVITLSYDFHLTPVVTGLMLLATLYLLVWDYDRLRPLLGVPDDAGASCHPFARPSLSGPFERAVYAVGGIAGVAMFSAFRDLLPIHWAWYCFPVAAASAAVAAYLGVTHRGARAS